jgi:DMSO/TMAO reductase YedYZ molybdopterin-dependent catalytic subunit
MLRPIAVALILGVATHAVWAADQPASGTLAIDGQIAHPAHLTADDLKKVPATDLDVTFMTGHGQESGHYTGALLWTVLEQAGLTDTAGKHSDLHHVLLATGSDGYVIAFSFGEIDPDFGNRPIIIAYAKDGKPLGPAGLRLVVPGDKLGARDIKDVVRIEVR